MVFTVRFILVVILLLATCSSASRRRSYRRSVPDDATSHNKNDTVILFDSQDKETIDKDAALHQSKPKTEISSQKYNDTNVTTGKTKTRGNVKYFTSTAEKSAENNSTTEKVQLTEDKAKKTEWLPEKKEKPNNFDNSTKKSPNLISQSKIEESTNVIETQLQNDTNKDIHQIKRLPEKDVIKNLNAVQRNVSAKVQGNTDHNSEQKNPLPETKNKPELALISENVEKPQNFTKEENNKREETKQIEVSTENSETTKRVENGRSLSMNIEKYISPEFHNQNNYYTAAAFPDNKKFVSFSKDFSDPIKSTERTNVFEINLHTDLTTPRNKFFDSKYEAVKHDVSDSLEGIDELFNYDKNDEKETEVATKDEVVNKAKLNDTNADIDYKKFKRLEASESKTKNRIHKNFLTENGMHLDLVSKYNDTKIIDDGLNKIPFTEIGASQTIPEKIPNLDKQAPDAILKKLTDLDKEESKRVLIPVDPVIKEVPKSISNKTDSDAEISALTNKIETEYAKTTPSVLVNIDPITADSDYEKNSKENAINVIKRGSTEKIDVLPTLSLINIETTSEDKIIKLPTVTPIASKKKESFKMPAEIATIAEAQLEKENAIHVLEKEKPIELSVVSENYTKNEKKTKNLPESILNVTTNKITETTTDKAKNITIEYPKSSRENLINVFKRGSTKIAEIDVDHEYFEGATMTSVIMKTSTMPTKIEEEPNEILPIITALPTKISLKLPESTTETTAANVITETTSIENFTESESAELSTTVDAQNSSSSFETDLTEESTTTTVTDSVEFNVSTEITDITEKDLTSTLAYTTEQFFITDNVSYYAASDDDSSIMYEVTTDNAEATISNLNSEDSNVINETLTSTEKISPSTKKNDTSTTTNLTENDIINQNEIYGEKDRKVNALNESVSSGSTNIIGIGNKDIHDIEDDLNPDDTDEDYVEATNKKNNQSDLADLEGDGGHVLVDKSSTSGIGKHVGIENVTTSSLITTTTRTTTPQINSTIINLLTYEDDGETTTMGDNLGLTGPVEEDNSGKIAAIVISSVGAVCLLLLAGLLIVMRKRQKRFNYGQRCRPVSLDAYSMDNVSICNTVGRRKGVLRASKRSYGNPAFDDPSTISHPLNFSGLTKFATNLEEIKVEFEEIPQVTTRTNELPEGCEVKNRYANVIPLPETRVYLNYIDGYPNSDYINANYVRGAKGARHYYIACQAPMSNTIDDFWRMIWEQQTKVILMLTNLYENGVEKCADYLPPSEVLDCHRVFGDCQVTLKNREVKDKYIISSLQLKNLVSNSWREITHLWYLEWPEKGVPEEANSIIAFLIEARSYMKASNVDNNKPKDAAQDNEPAPFELCPVVVHCSPGTGRTGSVIGCDIAIREFELSRQVDIPKIVYRIRRDRASSVQTKEQYAFIYKVINLYATKLTGGALDSI